MAPLSLALIVVLAVETLAIVGVAAWAFRLSDENQRLRHKLSELATSGAWSPAAAQQAAPTPSDVGMPVDVQGAIQRAVIEGRAIEAIKLYRQATGTGLAEAKAAVDAIRHGLGL